MATQKLYSDIDFTFTKKPVGADVALSYDTQAVIRSIRNILSTRVYEKKFDPIFGSNLDALLFELVTPLTAAAINNEIMTAIKNYEPRVNVQNIDVNPLPDQNAYSVTITFYLVNASQPTSITLLLERNR